MGFYIDITKIESPGSAAPGQVVNIKVTAKNKSTTIDRYILVMGTYDSYQIYSEPQYALVAPQGTQVFTISFTMPARSLVLGIWSYIWVEYPDQPGYWYNDDYREVTINLAELVPAFSEFKITDYKTI
jgi:hypothetical protein